MIKTVPPRHAAACLVLIALSITANTYAAKLVVTATDDPLLAPGMVIDSEKVTLAAGKTLTVITATGQKAVLKGPHDGPWAVGGAGAGSNDAARAAALASLLATGPARTSSVGVVRAVPGKAKPAVFSPDLRQISIAAPGVQCVAEGATPALWRPTDVAVTKVAVADAGGKEAAFDWGGSQTAPLPAGVAVVDQDALNIRLDEQPPIKVTLRVVPASITDPIERIVWMNGNQCTTQARALLDQMLRE